MLKTWVLERLLEERTEFELLVNRVSGSRMTIRGAVGRWSVKDTLAHLAAYEQYSADRLWEILRGETYRPSIGAAELDAFFGRNGYPDFGSPLLDEQSANEMIVERHKGIPLEDVVANENQAFLAVCSALERSREEVFIHHSLVERVANHTYDRYQENRECISVWLEAIQ